MATRGFEVKFKIEYDWLTQSVVMVHASESYPSGVLAARLRKLEDHYQNILSAYENILKTFTKDDTVEIENYDNMFQKATMLYNELDAMLAKYPVSEGSYVTTESAAHARLPTLDLPNFDGDIFGWYSFVSLYKSVVLSRKDLSKTEKYHYLFSHLQKEPRTLVQHLAMTDESLDTALEILKSRYENKRILVDRHLGRLINLPSLVNSRNLRADILNPILESTRSLKNLGLPVEEYMLVFIVLSKLPTTLKSRFEQKYGGFRNELPKFENLMDFLQNECHLIEAASIAHSVPEQRHNDFVGNRHIRVYDHGGNAQRTRNDFGGITQRPRGNDFAGYGYGYGNGNGQRGRGNTNVKCAFCMASTNHKLIECQKFCNSPLTERRNWIRSNALCYRCFGKHAAVSCTRNVPCEVCGNTGHHKLICLYSRGGTENNQVRQVNVGTVYSEGDEYFESGEVCWLNGTPAQEVAEQQNLHTGCDFNNQEFDQGDYAYTQQNVGCAWPDPQLGHPRSE